MLQVEVKNQSLNEVLLVQSNLRETALVAPGQSLPVTMDEKSVVILRMVQATDPIESPTVDEGTGEEVSDVAQIEKE